MREITYAAAAETGTLSLSLRCERVAVGQSTVGWVGCQAIALCQTCRRAAARRKTVSTITSSQSKQVN